MPKRKAASLRLPAGVRLGRQSLGGRFVSPAELRSLAVRLSADSAAAILPLVAGRVDAGAREVEKLTGQWNDDPARYAAALAGAEDGLALWYDILDGVLRRLEGRRTAAPRKRTAPRAKGKAPPRKGRRKEPPVGEPGEPPEDEAEDEAVEWEVGFGYVGHAASSNFDLTLRMSRADGRRMGEREAVAALEAFRAGIMQTGIPEAPRGYVFHGINWRRSRDHGWRPRGGSGTMDDLAAFAAPLYVEADTPSAWMLRLGAVEGRG